MKLADEIERAQEAMIPNIPAEALSAMMAATEKLVESGIADKAKKRGEQAPEFTLKNVKGEEISSAALLREGPLVISFYRGAWCPYCNLELKALDNVTGEIKKLGANLIAVSPNLREKSSQLVAENPFSFEILSDEGSRVAEQFGLVFTLAEELRPIYKGFGIDLIEYDGNDSFTLPIPATYVIGRDGIIVHSFVDADYTKRMEPDEIVEALGKLKG
ncbi:MAG: peroxiredoxin-like family protein [Thermodesulfobacteriota bacterium]